MIYPFSRELQQASEGFSSGNFGLWFYKLVPLDENFKACSSRGGDKNVAAFYRDTYNRLKNNDDITKILVKRHLDQVNFCRMHERSGAGVITIRAALQTSFITGIGKTHPNEVGITLDHTMGIPYLPATGVKGLVRLAHILNLMVDANMSKVLIQGEELDDTDPISQIPDIFGGDLKRENELEKRRGSVVFLDAYPENIPDLHVDIMNPHYRDYYSDDTAKTPPADYLNPVPVQFLAVQRGTIFVFRAIVSINPTLRKPVKKAFQIALAELGFGAKTAVGYGRFRVADNTSRDGKEDIELNPRISSTVQVHAKPTERLQKTHLEPHASEFEKLISKLNYINANDMGRLGTIIQKIDELESKDDKAKIAQAIKDKLPSKVFKKHKRRDYILSLIEGR